MIDPAYCGLAIVCNRNNTAPLGLVGGPDITINGGVYGASAAPRNNGTGSLTVNSTMVVGAVDLRGVPATVNINQDNRSPICRPSSSTSPVTACRCRPRELPPACELERRPYLDVVPVRQRSTPAAARRHPTEAFADGARAIAEDDFRQ